MVIAWLKRGLACAVAALGLLALAHGADGDAPPILVYHRFGASAADSMTVRSAAFAAQLEYLRQQGHAVVPLRQFVDHLHGGKARLPDKAVIVTVDDGHRSVYTEMLPLVRRYRIPVTLFIYPSAISNADYALTWAQLAELKRSGLFDIQSHTYWHPNFKREQRRLAPAAYRQFVRMQLVRPRQVLAQRLGVDADLLAWPFGIVDATLIAAARDAGYVAGFTLEPRPGAAAEPLALPRHLMTDAVGMRAFRQFVGAGPRP